ncbi:MAG: 1-acyl-sn-glycerol-3-phosphate acyltransferase [Firmicutes bacterium]|nr:1-acyl-sn-glycerol-3-phosphate acyltransferase [Bacillota bacterium]
MKRKNLVISNILYSIIRPILWLFLVVTINPKIVHRKRIPHKEGFIFAGTHTSYFDAFLIGRSTLRPIHFLAKKEIMDVKFLGPILNALGFIRVDRAKKNPGAINSAVEYLKNNKIICLFPEGTINKTEDYILPFKYGAVSLAYKSGKPIIPFAFVGGPKLFNYHVKVIIGNPYYVKTDNLEKENKILEQKVIELIKEGRSYGKRSKKRK